MEMRLSDIKGRESPRFVVPVRSPLIWWVLPWWAGCVLGEWEVLNGVNPVWWAVGSGILALGALRGGLRVTGLVLLVGAVVCAAVGWRVMHLPPGWPSEWKDLPPREVDVVVRVDRVFGEGVHPGYWRGLGTVVLAEGRAAEVATRRVVFSTQKGAFSETEAGAELWPNTELRLRGVLQVVEGRGDGFADFLRAEGVRFRLQQGRVLAVEDWAEPTGWDRYWAGARARVVRDLTRAPEGLEGLAGVVGAMLLGNRNLLEAERRESFLHAGVMHLFAVSGLHVMAVAGVLYGAGAVLRLPMRARTVAALGCLWWYVLLIGCPASALRAYSMLVIYVVGRGLGRRSMAFPAVVLSAAIWLVWDPGQWRNLGFQLSYGVISSILLLGLPLAEVVNRRLRAREGLALSEMEERWKGRFRSWRERTVQSLGVSLAAGAASASLIVTHFGVVSPGAVVLNLVLIPLTGLVVGYGMIVAGLGALGWVGGSQFLAHGGWLVARVMEVLVDAALWVPGTFFLREWRAEWLGWATLGGFWVILLGVHAIRRPGALHSPTRLMWPVVWVALLVAVGTVGS